MMSKTRLALGLLCLIVSGMAFASGTARAACDVPLVVRTAPGEANVLVLVDNSASMNEIVHDTAYDETVTYSGNFNSSNTYNVNSDGNYTPRDFKSTYPSTPTAYLVNSDGGQDGQYPGNYLNWLFFNATAAQRAAAPQVTRIQVAKQVVNTVVAAGVNTRFGIIIFNGDNGGTILSPIGTSVATIQSQVNGIVATSYTPLAETMVTALNYFKTTGAGAPITSSCQQTFVVMVTDGHPTRDLNVPAYIGDYDGDGQDPGTCASIGAPYNNSFDCSHYVDDVAMYLYKNDLRPDLGGIQNVTTYVVGFNINAPILQSTATEGGGAYYGANNAAQLATALNNAIVNIQQKISAGGAVSAVSAEGEANNRLYRARFESATWRGYLEAFDLPYTVGQAPAWQAGDLLQSRAPSSRNIYTSTTGTNTFNFSTANAATLTSSLNAADATAASEIIQYVRGTDVAGYRNRSGWKLGDIVDSAPVVAGQPSAGHEFLNYESFRAANLSRTEMVFVGANDGMLHCFNASNGVEEWGYIPRNELPRLAMMMDSSYCHEYYVNMTPAVYDIYLNGGWKTVLIGGEQRGGSGLFALDVTNPAAGQMSVLWDVDLPQLSGSWRTPTLIRDKTLDKFVLAVGTGLDSLTGQASLLEIDPADGSVIATYALGTPASVNMATRATAFDKDWDGYDDLLYVGDLAGKLWRVDLSTNPWTVTKLFDNSQPIQAAPVLSIDKQGRVLVFFGTGKYLTDADVSTTGTQSFYAVFDDHSGSTLTRASLIDQTSTIHAVTATDHGWFVDLVQQAGERVTNGAALVGGTLYIPSFRPNTTGCSGGGTSWFYSLDFEDGSAPDNVNGTENNTTAGRIQSMGDGILSSPAVDLANEDVIMQSSNTTMVSQDINASLRKMVVRSWRQKWN